MGLKNSERYMMKKDANEIPHWSVRNVDVLDWTDKEVFSNVSRILKRYLDIDSSSRPVHPHKYIVDEFIKRVDEWDA